MTWLAIIAAVNTVIGLAYYLRVAALLFAAPSDETVVETVVEPQHGWSRLTLAGTGVALAATVALSVYPQPLFNWADHAARATNAARP